MIAKIAIGDKIKCLDCERVFKLEHVEMTFDAEYITCPLCGRQLDIQLYHMFGEEIKEGE